MSGVRFFYMSYCDINRALSSISIDNNDDSKDLLINRDPFFRWESIGSDDSDTITLTADFGDRRTIDSLILVNHNLKNFSLEYMNLSSVWVSILSESDNEDTVYFNKFSEVTAQQVRLIMNTTMTEDAQKYIEQIHLTKQIGQFEGYPELDVKLGPNAYSKQMYGGKRKIVIDGSENEFAIKFKDHVGTNDRTIFKTLATLTEEFLIWPCGGDATQFAFNDEGWGLEDIYLVGNNKKRNHGFMKNLYQSGMTDTLTLIEVA